MQECNNIFGQPSMDQLNGQELDDIISEIVEEDKGLEKAPPKVSQPQAFLENGIEYMNNRQSLFPLQFIKTEMNVANAIF